MKKKNRKREKNSKIFVDEQQDSKAKTPKKKKSNVSTVILIVIFFIGVGILLYPTVSNWWNSFHQSRAIANYAEAVSSLSDEDCRKYMQAAQEYNHKHYEKKNRFSSSDTELREYNDLLNIDSTGIIGYIEIEKIKVSLPIYHGTADSVLQIATGHVDWSSLPIGGENTHSVISGHRGLPSAKLFTDLDELEEGDTFVIRVLNEVLTYEIDQILIVLPDDTSALEIVDGQDYVTLVTCTPYGINTHRLLVRGHRTENKKDFSDIKVTSDLTRIEPLIVASVIAAPLLILFFIIVVVYDKKRKNKKKKEILKDFHIELDNDNN